VQSFEKVFETVVNHLCEIMRSGSAYIDKRTTDLNKDRLLKKEIMILIMDRGYPQPNPGEGSSSWPRLEQTERQRVNPSPNKPFDVLRCFACQEDRSQRLANIVDNFNDYIKEIGNKLFKEQFPKKLQGLFKEAIDSLNLKMNEDYKQAIDSFKVNDCNSIKEAKSGMKDNILKIQQINILIDSYNKNIDSVNKICENISSLQKMAEETSFPEEAYHKFETKLKALTEFLAGSDNETKKITKQRMTKRMKIISDQIAEMTDHLYRWRSIDEQQKYFDKSIQNIQEKIQEKNLPAIFYDMMKKTLALLSQQFKASYHSVVDTYTQKLSFNEEGERAINDLDKSISKISEYLNQEYLDKWCGVQKASEELVEALPSVPEKYRSLARNLADREMRLAREAYRTLAMGQHRSLARNLADREMKLVREAYRTLAMGQQILPDPRDCFEKVCCLQKKRLEMLKGVFSKQTDGVGEDMRLSDEGLNALIKRYVEVKARPYDDESFEKLKKEWEEHARSREFLLAFFGDEDSYIYDKPLKRNFDMHMNFMDKYIDKISQNLEKKDLKGTEKWIECFINTNKAFNKYLKDHGWLGDTLIERFQRTFKTLTTEECEGMFKIDSVDVIGRGVFFNHIDVNKGEIIGIANSKEDTDDWYFSNVVYAQIQLALQKAGISQFVPTRWYGDNVVNEETKSVAESFLPAGETERTFEAGSEEFAAIARTATAKSKFHLLKDHFPNREVKSITVKRVLEKDKEMRLDIVYEIGERFPQG
jgi:hypothetical protein